MGINLKIRELKGAIYNVITKSDMPTEITRLVLSEVLREVSQANAQNINQEINELKAEAKKEADDIKEGGE